MSGLWDKPAETFSAFEPGFKERISAGSLNEIDLKLLAEALKGAETDPYR